MRSLIILIAVGNALLVGCSKAPYIPQNAVDLYNDAKINGSTPSEISSSISNNHKTIAKSYARRSDESAKNGLYNDMLSGGLLAGAGVGALTTAHSDLYKSLGALFGLSMGHKFYFNSTGQRSIYLLGAEATACTSRAFSKLSLELKGISQANITNLYDTVDTQAIELKQYLYSADTTKITLTPFNMYALLSGAVNADRDASSTKATLEFIMDLKESDFQSRKAVYTYITDEIYRTSFKSEEAFKKIASYSVNPLDLLKAINAANPNSSSPALTLQIADAEKATSGENKLRAKLPRITEIINQHQACITALPAQPNPT